MYSKLLELLEYKNFSLYYCMRNSDGHLDLIQADVSLFSTCLINNYFHMENCYYSWYHPVLTFTYTVSCF